MNGPLILAERLATPFTAMLQYVCPMHQNNWKDAIIYWLGKSIETLLPPASIMELPLHLHLAICLILHTDVPLPEALSTSNHYSGMQNSSGGSRNLERGVQLRVHEAHPKMFGLPRPLPDVNAHVIIVATGR